MLGQLSSNPRSNHRQLKSCHKHFQISTLFTIPSFSVLPLPWKTSRIRIISFLARARTVLRRNYKLCNCFIKNSFLMPRSLPALPPSQSLWRSSATAFMPQRSNSSLRSICFVKKLVVTLRRSSSWCWGMAGSTQCTLTSLEMMVVYHTEAIASLRIPMPWTSSCRTKRFPMEC